MSNEPKQAAVVPNFSFDPVEDSSAPADTRQAVIEQTREAFKKADYVPPEVKSEKPKAESQPEPVTKKRKSAAKKPAAPSDNVPAFRRRRGRPAGERQHRISMKTTERHLEFMYGIADGRELVGAFENALEALAREVEATGSYDGRKVPADVLKLAKALSEASED